MKLVYINDNFVEEFMKKIINEKNKKQKKYKILTTTQFLNPNIKFVNYIFFTSTTPSKIKKEIYKKKYGFSSPFESKPIHFSNKQILHDFIAKEDPNTFKKFFMKQYNYNGSVYKLNKDKMYIVKPTIGFSGFGIKVFNDKNKLKEYIDNFKITEKNTKPEVFRYIKNKIFRSNNDYKLNWIIQEYIENPLLIRERKFHIRVIILGTNINKISKIYLCKKSVMIPAKLKYTKDSLDMDVHDSHIGTTTEEEREVFPDKFINYFGKEKANKIENQIVKLLKKLKSYNFFEFTCYEETNHCYEMYGLDIMITDDFNIKCLEINVDPGAFGVIRNIVVKGLLDLTLFRKNKTENYIEI